MHYVLEIGPGLARYNRQEERGEFVMIILVVSDCSQAVEASVYPSIGFLGKRQLVKLAFLMPEPRVRSQHY